ncbi:hypothetical protein GCM10020221_31240 [Streptomyces thioluteus]|uniref:Uncharacterized protein n=1 Tax=Streptomyces thioluteus TaxID=66431 RepID=A0ABN3X2X5_STRTU
MTGHCLAGLCLVPAVAALALAALGGGPAELLRTGRRSGDGRLFLAAGVSVLRKAAPGAGGRSPAPCSPSPPLWGLYVLRRARRAGGVPGRGPLPPGWIPLLTSAGRSAGNGRVRAPSLWFAGPRAPVAGPESGHRRGGVWSTAVP